QKPLHPFCDKIKRDPLQTECSQDRQSVALCNLVSHEISLPLQFRHFESLPGVPDERVSTYGGSVVLADYCPYVQEFTWKSKNRFVRGSQCVYPDNNPVAELNFALEEYGPYSRCFDHPGHRRWLERTCEHRRRWEHWGSGCYEYICYDGRVHLMVQNHTFTCYNSSQDIEISLLANGWLHEGAIRCPDCRDVCENEGMRCRPPRPAPPSVRYHRDTLQCSAQALAQARLLLLLSLSVVWCLT
ncbi:unnamed protein product, partial [Cyprideis torosa]